VAVYHTYGVVMQAPPAQRSVAYEPRPQQMRRASFAEDYRAAPPEYDEGNWNARRSVEVLAPERKY
jgi:hypothetical protein